MKCHNCNKPEDYTHVFTIQFLGEPLLCYEKTVNGKSYWWSRLKCKWVHDSISGLMP